MNIVLGDGGRAYLFHLRMTEKDTLDAKEVHERLRGLFKAGTTALEKVIFRFGVRAAARSHRQFEPRWRRTL
jgi:hypothetical protein